MTPASRDEVAQDEVAQDEADREQDGRDRDADGRAVNARKRDALGRPVPRGEPGYEAEPREPLVGPEDALDRAQAFLDEGRAFAAHEVFEARWKQVRALPTPAGEELPAVELWQGLAQLAVGHTHLQRGNATGAKRLIERGSRRLEQSREAAVSHGIAVDGLLETARTALAGLQAAGAVDHRGASTPATAEQVAATLSWQLR